MKLAQVRQLASQLDDVACTAGINPHGEILRNGKVVNCREMKYARRLLLDQLEIRSAQRQLRLTDVALHEVALNVSSAELRDPGDLIAGTTEQRRLHQQDKIAVLPRESFEKPVRDEAWKSGYEECLSIRH